MTPGDLQTRRSAIRLVGTTAIGALLAGCGGPGLENEDDESDGTPSDTWKDVDTIVLEADADGWIGRAPDGIADAENPTLELYTGREYDLTWENGDGEYHNLSIHSRDEPVEHQLQEDDRIEATELLQSEGESIELTFEATAEMQGYVCEMHPQNMAGDIAVYDDGEDGNESANEDGGGNESEGESRDGGQNGSENDSEDGSENGGGGGNESEDETENGTEGDGEDGE